MWRNTTKEVNVTEQYTHTELLFAMQVREAAMKLRYQGVPDDLKQSDDTVSRAELAEWMAKHPLESYYPPVLEAVAASANTIRGILVTK